MHAGVGRFSTNSNVKYLSALDRIHNEMIIFWMYLLKKYSIEIISPVSVSSQMCLLDHTLNYIRDPHSDSTGWHCSWSL